VRCWRRRLRLGRFCGELMFFGKVVEVGGDADLDVGRCLWLPLLWMCCISGGRGIRARRDLRKRFLSRAFDTGAGSGVECAWTDNGDLLGWGVEAHAFLATSYERYPNCTSQIRRWVYQVTIVYHYITILQCRFVGKDLPRVPFPVQPLLLHIIPFNS